MFAWDYRPHSHHHTVLSQARTSATESGTVDVGGGDRCSGFMTGWGDGAFPVIVERDAGGALVRVRVQLGDDDRVKLLYDVMERARTD